MTEQAVPADGAGAMLRAAREAQGMHIAALAASIKIPQARLESLEAERYAELPDLAFTRALALRVCRALNIEAAPVLQRLPFAAPGMLEKVDGGLNAPFRERFERGDSMAGAWLHHTATWVVALVLAGAAAVAFVPTQWLRSITRGASLTPARAGASEATTTSTAATSVSLPPSSVAGAIVETIDLAASAAAGAASAAAASAARPASALLANLAAAPVVLAAASVAPRAAAVVGANSNASTALDKAANTAANAAANAAASAASGVQLHATEASWVQVTNSRGRVLFGRMLAAGEVVAVEGAPPMKIRIGNARGVELRLNGEQVNVAPFLRGNIADVVLR